MTDEEKLEKVRAQLDKLSAVIHRPDPVAQAFPLGRVGGSGNPGRIRRLNAGREASVEKVIDAAVAWKKLKEEEARLVSRIREASASWQAEQAAAAARQLSADEAAEAFLRTLPPGSPVESQYGTGTIVRHNRKGATVKYAMFQESIPYKGLWVTKELITAQLAAARQAQGAQA